jgi:cytoskeletal protein CcmA (bactofilin family)
MLTPLLPPQAEASIVDGRHFRNLVSIMFDRNKTSKSIPAEPAMNPDTQEVKKPSISASSRSTAAIGSTVRVSGDIYSEENLIIEGQVEGTISLNSHELTIGNSGIVNANISAKIIKVDGQVQGDLMGKEKVIITRSGNVRGNITAPAVILEEGGKFKGSIDMGPAAANTGDSLISDSGSTSKASRVSSESIKPELGAIKHG